MMPCSPACGLRPQPRGAAQASRTAYSSDGSHSSIVRSTRCRVSCAGTAASGLCTDAMHDAQAVRMEHHQTSDAPVRWASQVGVAAPWQAGQTQRRLVDSTGRDAVEPYVQRVGGCAPNHVAGGLTASRACDALREGPPARPGSGRYTNGSHTSCNALIPRGPLCDFRSRCRRGVPLTNAAASRTRRTLPNRTRRCRSRFPRSGCTSLRGRSRQTAPPPRWAARTAGSTSAGRTSRKGVTD